MKNVLATLGLLLVTTATAWAHHSFAAEFDASDIRTITGTITKFEWMNPHSYVYVDVPDESGKMVNWGIQSRNLSIMKRAGWSKDTLKPGEKVTVTLYHHKDPNKPVGFARTIEKADGTMYEIMVFGRPSGNVAP